jgi:thymidylate synthase ThyX
MIQLVKQAVIPWGPCPSDEAGILKRIEAAGRTAYKSEDKITDDSAKGFVQRMLSSGHMSVLEHSNIVFEVFAWKNGIHPDYRDLRAVLSERNIYHPIAMDSVCPPYFIGGNMRAWIETIQYLWDTNEYPYSDNSSRRWALLFAYHLSRFFPNILPLKSLCPRLWLDTGDALIDWAACVGVSSDWLRSTEKAVRLADTNIQFLPGLKHSIPVFSFKIIADRGILQEIARHRSLSLTVESTRYVGYHNRGFTFIEPEYLWNGWLDELFGDTCREYERLVESGFKPQIARDVLPNLLKTEIVVSGRWSGWKHFIELRDSPAAHPRIQKIAKEIRAYFAGIGLEV